MIDKREKIDFFELLRLNNNLELKKWLIDHGKSGKPFCPVRFLTDEERKKKGE